MALTPEELDKINGPGAAAELAQKRMQNALPVGDAAVHEALKGVANDALVVDPDASLAVHSGQVPVVEVKE